MPNEMLVTPEQLRESAEELITALTLFQADTVTCDYKVDISGLNNLNQAYTQARSKRSAMIGISSSFASNLYMIVNAVEEADKLISQEG